MKKIGIAGVGHLGKALIKQLEKVDIKTCFYHPDSEKRMNVSDEFKVAQPVTFDELVKEPLILLALPAEAIRPFIMKLINKQLEEKYDIKPKLVNLSSLINTNDLQKEFPQIEIFGVKMVGHADYLYEHGNGVFLTETSLEMEGFKEVRELFESIGKIFKDDEMIVSKINGLAVKSIIKACIDFEKETEGFLPIYREKAMDTIFPNTMRLYREGSLDGFMLDVIEKMNLEDS